MNRRHFIQAVSLSAAALAVPRLAQAQPQAFTPTSTDAWRSFEVTTRVAPPAGTTRLWLPLPSVEDDAWVQPLGNQWQSNASQIEEITEPVYGARLLAARFEPGSAPKLELVSRIRVRDRAIDLTKPGPTVPLDAAGRALYTRATELLPIDGIVRQTAERIVAGQSSDVAKARAIYEWIVDNTQRNPKTRGCGRGDIRFMLETGDLTGKCADLNALYVGLARAAGLPARDVYGIRVGDSRFGYKSLGKSGDISKAQHCRAEVWLAGFGWVPVDPADVRKVVLEEQPGLTFKDEVVVAVRQKLFGAWETNWLPYNHAHDLTLPGSHAKVPYLMYPQGETSAGLLDSVDPKAFGYSIDSREITA